MPSSTQGHQALYDETLLAAAPAATKKQIQGGYNPDLLQEKVTPSVTPPPRNVRDVEAQLPSREVSITPAPTPFYRTKKGVIIIAVVAAVVIIAAVVGGAVGGSKKHKTSVLPVTTSSTHNPQGTSQTGAAGATQEGGSPVSSSGSNPQATALPTVVSTGLPTVISITQPVQTTTQGQGQGK